MEAKGRGETKILVFPLYFPSITSFISILMLDYPLRVNLKKIGSSYSKFSMLLPNVQSPRLSRLVCGCNSLKHNVYRYIMSKLDRPKRQPNLNV